LLLSGDADENEPQTASETNHEEPGSDGGPRAERHNLHQEQNEHNGDGLEETKWADGATIRCMQCERSYCENSDLPGKSHISKLEFQRSCTKNKYE